MFDDKTKSEIVKIARRLDVPAAALLAVAKVESGGQLTAKVRGKVEPLIRFEGHYFDRLLCGDARLEARAEGLANPKAGAVKNPRSQTARWQMLNQAIKINRTAALSSASWGVGQVMGSHWQWLGYGSVDALVVEARSGPAGQVALMARYIEKAGLKKALQERDWTAFARIYKGPSFRKSRYDEKVAKAFLQFTEEAGKKSLPSILGDHQTLTNDDNFDDRLMFGARGLRVRKLQKALTRIGYVLVADGLYGLVTDRTVRQFQRDRLIAENGIFDSRELALLTGHGSKVKTAALNVGATLNKLKNRFGTQAVLKIKTLLNKVRRRLRQGLLFISRRIA